MMILAYIVGAVLFYLYMELNYIFALGDDPMLGRMRIWKRVVLTLLWPVFVLFIFCMWIISRK